MHPLLANPRRLGVYLLAWLPFAGLLDGTLRSAGMDPAVVPMLALAMALFYAFLGLTPYYLCRLAPLPQSSIWRALAIHAPAASLTTSLWLAGAALVVSVAEEGFGRSGQIALFRQTAGSLFTLGVLAFALSVAFHYLAMAFERSRRAERRALELQVVARDAELKVLRAQIDPHFLFNSLHSIAALTTTDPPAARRMCVLLGDFLRAGLRVGQRPFITLSDELSLVRGYLAIEQVRLGARLQVIEHVAEGIGDVEIPPLLLHPLVENAVTHGIGQLLEGGRLDLRAGRDSSGRVRVSLTNTCDPDRPRRAGTGVGLENVRRRLATVYGHEASLTLREQPDRFDADLVLPGRMHASETPAGAQEVHAAASEMQA